MRGGKQLISIASVALVWFTLPAELSAAEGDWLIRAGVHQIDPKSNNHPVVSVESAESLTISGSYFVTDVIAVDFLVAYPFKHDITLAAGESRVGKTTHLPPTVSVQYHPLPNAVFRPYIGVGLNYTVFYNEKTLGGFANSRLTLDDSLGLAAEVGVDFGLGENWALNLNVRWFDIDTRATLDAADLGSVAIDPYAYGLMVTRKIRF